MAEFNPFDFSAKDTRDSLAHIYADRRENSLRLASGIMQGLYRHELKNASQKLTAAANTNGELDVTVGEIDNLIIQLMQARRHIADVDKCDAVMQALKQIEL